MPWRIETRTMTTAATINSTLNAGVAESAARRDRREDAVRSGVDAFAALLDATRQTVQARTLATTRESPAQMFEANGESESDEPKETSSEGKAARSETPPAAQAVSGNGTMSSTTRNAAPLGASHGAASLATGPSQAPVQPAVASPVVPSVDSAIAPKAATAASSGELASEFTQREQPSAVPKFETNSPQGAAAIASNATPAIQNAAASVSSEATLARTVGEALGAKGSEPMVVTRGADAERPVPSGRPPANTATKSKPDSSAAGEASKPPATESDSDVTPFERLVRSLRMQVGERYSTARMRLNPPELGEMRVDVHLRGDEVELEVRTTDEAARRIVAGRAEELRSALEQGGVTVRRFDVLVDETMAAALPRFDSGSRAAGTPKRKSEEAERESEDRAGVRRALSRRGRLDVRG